MYNKLNVILDKWQCILIKIHSRNLLRCGRSTCKQIKPDIS